MKRVSVVGSVHAETGQATAGELCWLLTRLKPDAVFLERSPAALTSLLDGSCQLLESVAVRRFRQQHPVELIPVDLPLPAEELKVQFDRMLGRVEDASHRFCALQEADFQQKQTGGFAYINSPMGVALQFEMMAEMGATIRAMDDASLTSIYARWVELNASREEAMFLGVERFAEVVRFERGVMVVGAAHVPALIHMSQQGHQGGVSQVTWDFEWQHEISV